MSQTINPNGSAVLIEAVWYRHHQIYIEECDSIEQAQRFLDYGEDAGEISSVGVYVDGKPHSAGPWDWHPPCIEGRRSLKWMQDEYAYAKAADPDE